MNRREFLKVGVGSLAAITVGDLSIPAIFKSDAYAAVQQTINLSITEALVEMVDLTPVYMWTFADEEHGPHFPGPVIFVRESDVVRLKITNQLDEDHAFAIHGTRIKTGIIRPGQTKRIFFVAPPAGTYIYFDPLNAPVIRVLGLHGAIVVLPRTGNTPYRQPTSQVQQLFNDLGTTAEFPGHPWNPTRTWIWLFHNIDPRWHQMAQTDQPFNSRQLRNEFLPRYFTINGKSGFFASHDMHIALHGHVGEPALVRIVNAGLATHSPHLHANHFFVIAKNGRVQDNLFFIDTVTVRPLDRVDWLVPFERPPDIPAVHPNNPQKLLRLDAAEELGLSFGGVAQSPLDYPMHCHMEMSQTAAGGNYPLGLISHIDFTGDKDGVPFP